MKGIFIPLLFITSAIAERDHHNAIIDHPFQRFELRHVSNSYGSTKHSSSRKKKSSPSSGEVTGYKVKWFQYFSLTEDSNSYNVTQFGTWYEDDVNNATRTETVTYYDGVGYASEYVLMSDGTAYNIEEDETTGQVYCQITTPPASEDISLQELGYAFFIPVEEAFPIVWGPRLVTIYYDASTNEDTEFFYGMDAFTDEPVFFSQYNTTFEQAFIWSRIYREDVDASDFVVPSDISCTSSSSSTDSSVNMHDDDQGMAWYNAMTADVIKQFKL